MACLDSPFGRSLGALVAASLLAGVSMSATAAGDKGTIDLELSNSGGANRFVWVNPADGKSYTQYFSVVPGSKCVVEEDGWVNYVGNTKSGSAAPSLVDIKAIRPVSKNPVPGGYTGTGLYSGSLGVLDSTKGVSCGKMSDSLDEGLVLTSKVGAFDEIRLDMEVKGSGRFELIIDPDPLDPTVRGNRHFYTLYSGTDIPADATSGLQGRIDIDNDGKPDTVNKFACSVGSDSGPDSGINDNCQWRIRDVGTSFSLRPVPNSLTTGVDGEGSLEGGGDYVAAGMTGDNVLNTEILLTSLVDVGQLGCYPSPPTGPDNLTARVFSNTEPAASCQVTRIKTSGDACDYVLGYKLETFTFDSRCALDKSTWVKVDPATGAVVSVDPSDPAAKDIQLAGSNQITFNLEDRDVWDIDETYMTFTKYVNKVAIQTGKYTLHRCGGTVIYVDGQPTIKEVLEGTLEGYLIDGLFIAGPPDGWKPTDGQWADYAKLSDDNDAVPTNGVIDWACVLDNTEIYEGSDLMRVIQRILFWGDAVWARG